MTALTCFKACDIHGRLVDELNEDIAYRIDHTYAQYLNPKRVVVGGDARLTIEPLKQVLAKILMISNDVIDICITGTEDACFPAFHLDVDGSIEVTASHNCTDYNGMKLVARSAEPIGGDGNLKTIKVLAEANRFPATTTRCKFTKQSILETFVPQPLKLIANACNGAAGHALEARFKQQDVSVHFLKIYPQQDDTFPNGIPNLLLPKNRPATAEAVRVHQTDMGIAWDGDFDRRFIFDENDEFIEDYYIVSQLAEVFLVQHPGEKGHPRSASDMEHYRHGQVIGAIR